MSELLVEQYGSAPKNLEYELYDALLAGQNMAHPARQGLGEAEFSTALADPKTACTKVIAGGEVLAVPQLMPLHHIKWLNQEFYEERFPNEQASDTLRYFNDSIGVEPSAEVRGGLSQLAKENGVLVFDYPKETDPAYPERLRTTLENLGISMSEIEELGTQTYFAGKSSLKRQAERLQPPRGFSTAFAYMMETGQYDTAMFENGASLSTAVPINDAMHINQFYEAALAVLNEHPCKQGMSPDEFVTMVSEDTDVAKILYRNENQVETLCILSEDLTKFDWINPSYFANRYPEEFAKQQVAYFPAIATDPSKQGVRNSQEIINLLARICEAGDNEVVVAFDCCDMNNGFLNTFLENIINATPETAIQFTPVGSQRYCAVRLAS